MLTLMMPMLIVTISNVFYNICTKSVPKKLNSFMALLVTYGVSLIATIAFFFITKGDSSISMELSKLNWASILLGFVVVLLEFGCIFVYRVGWKISIASLIINIMLAMVLLVVGVLFYKETISFIQLVGMLCCGAGLIFMGLSEVKIDGGAKND